MTYQNNDRKAVVRHIQEMLRAIQISNGSDVNVPIDGFFGNKTKDAVRDFQLKNGISPTGDVDSITYYRLYDVFTVSRELSEKPLPLPVLTDNRVIIKNEQSDAVSFVQLILNTLTVSYDDYLPLEVSGYYNNETEAAVRRFQMRNGIKASGEVDKETWNAMIKNYSKHIKNV